MLTSTLSALIATLIAVPAAYRLTRSTAWRRAIDPLIEVVLAIPPLVVGLCLLLLFRQGLLRPLDDWLGVSLQMPAVVIAQTVVATALAVRLMRSAFDRIPTGTEEIARSLGGSPAYVFRKRHLAGDAC